MSALVWSDELVLSMPELDQVHEEFVGLLAKVNAASDDEVMPLWHDLVTHTEAHFALEDRWMSEAGFLANNCHSRQHAAVLEVLKEGAMLGDQGNVAPLRQMADELAVWFAHHAQTMDAGLVSYLQTQASSAAVNDAPVSQSVEPSL